jgi:hypothetical protein
MPRILQNRGQRYMYRKDMSDADGGVPSFVDIVGYRLAILRWVGHRRSPLRSTDRPASCDRRAPKYKTTGEQLPNCSSPRMGTNAVVVVIVSNLGTRVWAPLADYLGHSLVLLC